MTKGRDLLRQSLKDRIDRLKKLSDLNAPSWVLAIEVVLVFKAAFAWHRDVMGRVFGTWLAEVASAEVAVCPNCGGYRTHEVHACEACLSKAEAGSES